MALQLGNVPRSWPAATVHDTVAAVMRQRAYQRSLRQSLMERFFRWLAEQWTRLMEAIAGIPHGRALAVGLAVVLAVIVVARLVYAGQLREDELRAARRRPTRRGETTAPWDDAQRLAAEGRYEDAAHALYRALLNVLVARERLRLHPSKTSGDYARELRARGSASYASFRQFGRRYDRVLFGTGTCDAAAYEQLLRDARPVLDAERAA